MNLLLSPTRRSSYCIVVHSLLLNPITKRLKLFHRSSKEHLTVMSLKSSVPDPNHYDSLILGSGQAGTPLSISLSKTGHRTGLIEKSHVAGCCVNEGCTPTKTLIASGRVAYLARRGQDYGVHTQSVSQSQAKSSAKEQGEKKGNENEIKIDMLKIRQRKRDIVESFRGGSEKRLAAAGVEVIMGTASFLSPTSIKVTSTCPSENGSKNERILTANKIFINVGESPSPPTLEGVKNIDKDRVLDSTSIQELDVVPSHLVVIGGGYVGVEFAQLFRRLGSKVTVLQRGRQLLPREDAEIAECLLEILREDGLEIYLESSPIDIKPSPTSLDKRAFTLTLSTRRNEEKVKEITASHILIATGRTPNIKPLNLPLAGIATNESGYIIANEYLETNVPNIYVLGDVKGAPAFTHISYDDFRILEHNLITLPPASPPTSGSAPATPDNKKSERRSTMNRLVPYVVYTDPQLAHVGLQEKEVRRYYPHRKIKNAKMPMAYVARALETDESRGMMKATVDDLWISESR